MAKDYSEKDAALRQRKHRKLKALKSGQKKRNSEGGKKAQRKAQQTRNDQNERTQLISLAGKAATAADKAAIAAGKAATSAGKAADVGLIFAKHYVERVGTSTSSEDDETAISSVTGNRTQDATEDHLQPTNTVAIASVFEPPSPRYGGTLQPPVRRPTPSSPQQCATSNKRQREEDFLAFDVESGMYSTPRITKKPRSSYSMSLISTMRPCLSQYRLTPKNLVEKSMSQFETSELCFSQHSVERGAKRFGFQTENQMLTYIEHGTFVRNRSRNPDHDGLAITYTDDFGVQHLWPLVFENDGKVLIKTYIANSPLHLPQHAQRRAAMMQRLEELSKYLHVPFEDIVDFLAHNIHQWVLRSPRVDRGLAWTIDVLLEILPTDPEIACLAPSHIWPFAGEMGDVEKWVVAIAGSLPYAHARLQASKEFVSKMEAIDHQESTKSLHGGGN